MAHSANFSKPRMDRAVVSVSTAASGAKDSESCDVCATREWQVLVLFKKIGTFV